MNLSSKSLFDATDVPHPILEEAHKWEIVGLSWRSLSPDRDSTVIDLLLRRGEALRALRFLEPRNLEIEEGGPVRSGGFSIFDVSRRGWERIGVRVTDLEASRGTVHFWAWRVESIAVEEFGRHENLL